MLQAYMDDSGSHDEAPHCLVAGYWGGAKEWQRFERAWKQILDSEGIPEFHAKVFWQRPRLKEYRDWSDERALRFINRLLSVIEAHKIYPFGCGVQSSEWAKQPERFRRIFAGYRPSSPVKESKLKSIFLPFQMCVCRAAGYCHPCVTMHFVYDDDQRIAPWAAQCYAMLKRDAKEDNDPLFHHLGDLTFADSRKAVPLQAADLLAYELYRYAKKRGGPGVKIRVEGMRALRNFRAMEDFYLFDEVRFRNLRAALEATAKRMIHETKKV